MAHAIKMYSLILSCLVISGTILYGQDSDKEKLTRQEKQELRKQETAKRLALYNQLVQEKSFVLEADELSNKYGGHAYVTSSLNFIKVDSTQATIQIGNPSWGPGHNNVGGITVDGTISKYEIDRKEKTNSIYIDMMVVSALGNFHVYFSIFGNSNAEAQISGVTTGGDLTFTGDIKPIYASGIYKGFAY